MSAAGKDGSACGAHSLRISGATARAFLGEDVMDTKAVGTRSSDAYKRYLRERKAQLLSVSRGVCSAVVNDFENDMVLNRRSRVWGGGRALTSVNPTGQDGRKEGRWYEPPNLICRASCWGALRSSASDVRRLCLLHRSPAHRQTGGRAIAQMPLAPFAHQRGVSGRTGVKWSLPAR